MTIDSDGTKRWLFVNCEDLADLEILARFHELPADEDLNETQVAALTKFPLPAVTEALARLCSRGLLSPTALEPVRYRYGVEDPGTREQVDRIVLAYRSDPLEIIGLMTTNAIERVRTEAGRTFAECFRIKRGKPNG